MSRQFLLKDIIAYAPHRPPMVWVNEIKTYGIDQGECLVQVDAHAHYMSAQGLRASSCLEFIAQSYGYMSICQRLSEHPAAKPLKRAFLAAVNHSRFASPEVLRSVRAGDTLAVKISHIRQIGAITRFTGKVWRASDLLCESQMKIFSESR